MSHRELLVSTASKVKPTHFFLSLQKASKIKTLNNELLALAEKHGREYVYDDFVKVYDHTDDKPNPKMVDFIKGLVKERYAPDEYLAVVKLFTILYMAMVAEYYYVNRAGRPSRLKKRTKRLGIYQFLFGGLTVEQAKEYSKGRSFAELDELCRQYGF